MASTYTWSLQAGSLPPGTSLSLGEVDLDITLTGTPTTVGSYNFTVRITNDVSGAFDDQSYTVDVFAAPDPPNITTTSLSNGIVGKGYVSAILAVAGDDPGPYIWSLDSGSLPAGLTLDTGETDLSTDVSGVPTTAGTYNFDVKIEDQLAESDTQPYLVLIGNDLGDLEYRVSAPFSTGAKVELYVSELTGGDQAAPVDLGNNQRWDLFADSFRLAGTAFMGPSEAVVFKWRENAHLPGRLQAIVHFPDSLPFCTNTVDYPGNP